MPSTTKPVKTTTTKKTSTNKAKSLAKKGWSLLTNLTCCRT